MRLKNILIGLPFLCSLTFSASALSKVWIPHGEYSNEDLGFNLRVNFKTREVSIGSNICYVSGKLTQSNKSKSTYIVKDLETDGMVCPYIKSFTITALDGPNSHAQNGARTLKISHKLDKSNVGYQRYSHRDRANFNGYYTYSSY